MLEHELAIIDELHFPGYFLVVWDIVQFCRAQGILCQGRGSAANSAVCYALDITAVDAVFYGLMFERFLAPERGEPPDIDIDIESDRREEVIQYVYELHGREHAAQVANVITYRPKSAVRDIAKALGYSPGQQDAWSKEIEQRLLLVDTDDGDAAPTTHHRGASWSTSRPGRRAGRRAAERPAAPGHPLRRHGDVRPPGDRGLPGRVGTDDQDRTVLQWDKDDCAEIGLVKFDLLGLGMLSAIHYCFDLIAEHHGITYELATRSPRRQRCVYDMLCAADSVGVFQVESRAQMATLPRLQAAQLLRPGLSRSR